MISVDAFIAESGAEDDGTLEDMIQRATEFVQTMTRRYFGVPVPHTYRRIGHGSTNLYLPEPPTVMDADPLIVEERMWPGDDPTLIIRGDSAGADEFDVRPDATRAVFVRYGRTVWFTGYEYTTTYTRGYLVDMGPGDVRQLVYDLVKNKLDARTLGADDLKSETIDNYAYTRFGASDLDAIGKNAWAVIDAWKVLVYA
jgi:hypothetical protein